MHIAISLYSEEEKHYCTWISAYSYPSII